MPQGMPDLPILVAAVGTKEEQHSPSPEPERRKESAARFARAYVASFGLEVAGKCKNPPKEPEVQQALRELSRWEWSDFYRQVLKGRAENWDATIPEHHNAMVRRVLEDNPKLIGPMKVVVIDAMHQVPDPNRNKALQAHKGLHPETMRHTASHLHDDQYQYLADCMVDWTASFQGEDRPEIANDLVVITACKVERHRSIAGKELIAQMLSLLTKELRIEVLRIQGDMPHWDKLCPPECEECSWSGKARQDSVRGTVIEFTKMTPPMRVILLGKK